MTTEASKTETMETLKSAAVYLFKLSFGLFNLLACWLTVTIKNRQLPAHDTEQEKQELATGMAQKQPTRRSKYLD